MKGNWFTAAVAWVWSFIEELLGFLREASGKYSHKRLIAVALAVVAIFLLFQQEWWGAGIAGAVVVVLSLISAITRT